MRLSTKLASAAGAIGLAAGGALAAFGTFGTFGTFGASAAPAHAPAAVHLASTTHALPTQVAPAPAPGGTGATAGYAAEAPEAPDSGAETSAEPANEPQLPGGGHADAPGANADNQFEGVQ